MRLKKLQCLLYTLIFCLAFGSSALAADSKDLIAWGDNPAPVSSDPAGTLDYMPPDNPNSPKDVAMLECELEDDHHLKVTIGPNPGKKGGAYPGYQASFTAAIVNTTSDQVKITDVVISDQPEAISVGITDLSDNNLIGKVLNANESITANVITRVESSARQNTSYSFTVRIDAMQEVGSYNPPGGGGGGGSGLPNEPVDIPPDDETLSPQTPGEQPDEQQEPIELLTPPKALAELPYTGGNVAMFMGTALSLGCIGLLIRYRP